jgi:hypothetical protein
VDETTFGRIVRATKGLSLRAFHSRATLDALERGVL